HYGVHHGIVDRISLRFSAQDDFGNSAPHVEDDRRRSCMRSAMIHGATSSVERMCGWDGEMAAARRQLRFFTLTSRSLREAGYLRRHLPCDPWRSPDRTVTATTRQTVPCS